MLRPDVRQGDNSHMNVPLLPGRLHANQCNNPFHTHSGLFFIKVYFSILF